MSAPACEPTWHQHGEECPYGSKVYLPTSDFTWHDPLTLMDTVAMLYSSFPFFIPLAVSVLLLVRRRFRAAAELLVFVAMLQFSNWVLKKFISQPRPEGSCLTSCGMPSGHATFAVGAAIYAACIIHAMGCKQERLLIALAMVMLLPIVWARVQLRDHSIQQVTVGSFCGVCTALLFLRLRDCLEEYAARPSGAAHAVGGVGAPPDPIPTLLEPRVPSKRLLQLFEQPKEAEHEGPPLRLQEPLLRTESEASGIIGQRGCRWGWRAFRCPSRCALPRGEVGASAA